MDIFESKKIAIIGSGHIAYALVYGLINCGYVNASDIIVSNPSGSGLAEMQKKFGVKITRSNTVAAKSDWIFVTVRPLVVKKVIRRLSKVNKDKLIVSFAAGVTIKMLKSYADGYNQKFVRVMPNISIACNQGVMGIFASCEAAHLEVKWLCKLLSNLGQVIVLQKEQKIEILTLVSACGPAIVANFIEILSNFGIKMGLSKVASQSIAMQTFKGTISYIKMAKLTPALLKHSVATKGGVTEAILEKMKEDGLESVFHNSMHAGYTKIKALQQKLDK